MDTQESNPPPTCRCITQFQHSWTQCAGSYNKNPHLLETSEEFLRMKPVAELLMSNYTNWLEGVELYPRYPELFNTLMDAKMKSNPTAFLGYLDRFVASAERILPIDVQEIGSGDDTGIVPGEVNLLFCALGNLCRKEIFEGFFGVPLAGITVGRFMAVKDTLEAFIPKAPSNFSHDMLATLPKAADNDVRKFHVGKTMSESDVESQIAITEWNPEVAGIASSTEKQESKRDNDSEVTSLEGLGGLDRIDSGINSDFELMSGTSPISPDEIERQCRKDSAIVEDMSPVSTAADTKKSIPSSSCDTPGMTSVEC